jgi:pimeloyl-ACP methyl ester carboxylesterase
MANFVLIHGGCHGGWCWERVVPMLEAAGHSVVAPDLPGAGNDPMPLREVTLAGRADFVAGLVAKQSAPVILVGHSMGGLVVSAAAEAVPEKVAAVVYLAAFMLKDGESMWQAAARSPAPADYTVSDDGVVLAIGETSVRENFYNTTPEAWILRVLPRLTKEAAPIGMMPVHVTGARYGKIPRYYIETLQDRALVPDLQRLMQADWPCRRTFTIDGDHSPFYASPEELVGHLEAIAGEVADIG